MKSLFTRPDAWTGGNIDALMYFGRVSADRAVAVARALWSYPMLDGPYQLRDREPEDQSHCEFSAAEDGGWPQSVGVLTHFDGSRSSFVHTTIRDDDGLWVYAGPTLGGLPPEWKIGAYPIEDGAPTLWLEPLLRELRALTDHVHQRCPILAAAYGWLDLSDLDTILNAIAGVVPEERWTGLAIWRDSGFDYYPPTSSEAPIQPRGEQEDRSGPLFGDDG